MVEVFIIEPCPFCGSSDVEPNHTKPGTKTRPKIYWVNCNGCDATGPEKKTLEEALEAWEFRK